MMPINFDKINEMIVNYKGEQFSIMTHHGNIWVRAHSDYFFNDLFFIIDWNTLKFNLKIIKKADSTFKNLTENYFLTFDDYKTSDNFVFNFLLPFIERHKKFLRDI